MSEDYSFDIESQDEVIGQTIPSRPLARKDNYRRGLPFTEAEKAIVRKFYDAGRTTQEAANAIGRAKRTVNSYSHRWNGPKSKGTPRVGYVKPAPVPEKKPYGLLREGRMYRTSFVPT